MPDMPGGTITFLFTDIERSTRLWEDSPSQMSVALARHDVLLRQAIERHDGHVFKTVGDEFCAAFASTPDAVAAALRAQQELLAQRWPDPVRIKVRMALHCGRAEVRADDYFGPPLNRIARLLAIGHGGQVLLSEAAAAVARASLPDGAVLQERGEHRLKDLQQPERVYQLCHPDLPATFPPLRSLSTHPNNLPLQPTSFIGRERELAELRTLLGRTRLITLTGMGGCGKTRLAMQLGAELVEAFPDGVLLVELAALSDPALVPRTVGTVFGLKEAAGIDMTQALVNHLADKRVLLVLDNAEHLVGACAALADALLRRCPNVILLASSRQPLRIAGELTYRVPSLSVPDPARDTTPERLSQHESAQLFLERAQFHVPQFTLTDRCAPGVATICYRLGGIPLAIELAAARVRSMSVDEISRRLDERFGFLTGGSRTALPRQQTLRALIDWSYDLLSEPERALLCRLAVFSGGRTIEAAEKVCSGEGVEQSEVLDLLASLADKSLLVPEERGGTTRYRMLETVRQYAWDRLCETAGADQWRDRHLAYFLSLAEEAEPQLTGGHQREWLERLEAEHDNLRAALAWASTIDKGAEAGLRLTGAIWRFWHMHGHASEGRGAISRFLAATSHSPPTLMRAKALNGAAALAHQQGDYPTARSLYEASLAMRRALGDRRGIANSLNNLGAVANEQGDYATSLALHKQSLAILRELGDLHGVATALNNLGSASADQGDYAAARTFHEESLAIRRKLGDRKGLGTSLGNLGGVFAYQGDYATARALHEESLAVLRELGDPHGLAYPLTNLGDVIADQGDYGAARALYEESLSIQLKLGNRWGVAASMEGLAHVAAGLGHPDRAARIWSRSAALREEIGVPLTVSERTRFERHLKAARAALGDDAAFDREWSEGRSMPLDEAVEYALDSRDP